ncbi:MAG: 50S ribosome-binding GTPase [Candidatus Lokiarchaeota archaeon]|nr:50S ribosome-binding GTPase [Candidatus Lokiarchaeota archaeon]
MTNPNSNKSVENSKKIKILVMGLDNSGKSSIVNCLRGIKNISAFNSPKPTRGRVVQNFEALNSNYAIWDFGGQRTFRDAYFQEIDGILKGTSKIIYTIDLQDVNRYDEALEYMRRVITSINKQQKIEFLIFLHKFDPDLVFNEELNEAVINSLIKKIKVVTPPKFTYSLHRTSIYAIFEKTLIP